MLHYDMCTDEKRSKRPIDPKDLMAVERSTTALVGTAISLIVLGFIVEKFELFLHLIEVEFTGKNSATLPPLQHIAFYNYLGIAIVAAGIVLALFTYRYYLRWIRHLERGEIDTDKAIYFYLSLFVASIGLILLISMILI
ncbi:YidH family protein [Nitratifractor sp.]